MCLVMFQVLCHMETCCVCVFLLNKCKSQLRYLQCHFKNSSLNGFRSFKTAWVKYNVNHWAFNCWVTQKNYQEASETHTRNLIFVVPSIMLYSSEICPTRCNNCVLILRNGFTLHVSGDNLTHHQEYVCCIWPQVSRLT